MKYDRVDFPLIVDIKFYSQFNEVKRSIFFICNWSKFLQKKIANCLIKSIYMP